MVGRDEGPVKKDGRHFQRDVRSAVEHVLNYYIFGDYLGTAIGMHSWLRY